MAEKKNGIHVEPIHESSIDNTPASLDIPGWQFSWQNVGTNEKQGWGIHRPVMRDTELGAAVAKKFGITGTGFAGMHADSNLFYNGADLVLAYTSQKLYDKSMAAKDSRADMQMRELGEDAKVQTRHANISKGIKKGSKSES